MIENYYIIDKQNKHVVKNQEVLYYWQHNFFGNIRAQNLEMF